MYAEKGVLFIYIFLIMTIKNGMIGRIGAAILLSKDRFHFIIDVKVCRADVTRSIVRYVARPVNFLIFNSNRHKAGLFDWSLDGRHDKLQVTIGPYKIHFRSSHSNTLLRTINNSINWAISTEVSLCY